MNAMCENKTNSFFGGGKIFSWKFQILRTLLRFFLTIKRSDFLLCTFYSV